MNVGSSTGSAAPVSPPAPPAAAAPYVPKLTGASAARLNALLESLTGLLNQAVAENDAEGASEGLADLFADSPEDLAALLDASLQAQRVLKDLEKALHEALAGNPGQASENYRKLSLALAQIQSIYQERNRRQLEQDWNFMWRLMYRQERNEGEESDLTLPSLPAGLPLSAVQSALVGDSTDLGRAREMLSVLKEQQAALSPYEQATLLDGAYQGFWVNLRRWGPKRRTACNRLWPPLQI